MKKQCVVRTRPPYSKTLTVDYTKYFTGIIDYTKYFKGTEELEERLNSGWLVISSQKLDDGEIEYILEKEVENEQVSRSFRFCKR